MTQAGSSSPHGYFKELEEAFIRLRGAPLLLSPSDWQIAKQWREQGIPLELAVRVMERIFERQESPEKRTGIRSLKYFRSAVEQSWRRIEELGAGEARSVEFEPLDVVPRLKRLAKALEAEPDEALENPFRAVRAQTVERMSERVLGLSGDPETVEGDLRKIDTELLARGRAALAGEALAVCERAVEADLERIAGRMVGEAREETRRLLLRRELRRRLFLPALSLFSPDADRKS